MDVFELGLKVDSSGATKGINDTKTGLDGLVTKAKLVSAALVGVGTAIVALGTQFDEANRNILVATGAVGDLADTLKNDLLVVLNQVPDSINEVASVLGTLNTFTGASGTALQGMGVQLLNVSRLLGEEAAPNAETFGKMIKQWDVPLSESTGLMDKLYVITQDYGISLTKLSGDLVTFGPIMENAGFSIEETALVMGQMNAAGVDWTRIAPGLNAATRKLADEGVTDIKGALLGTIDQLRNAKTETEALSIATEAFGAEGAQRMVSGVRDGAFALDDLNEVLGGSKGAINDATAEMETLGDKMGKLANQIKVALEPAATAAVDALKFLADNADVVAVALGSAGLAAVLGLVAPALLAASAATVTWTGTLALLNIGLGAFAGFLSGPLGIITLIGLGAAGMYKWTQAQKLAIPTAEELMKSMGAQAEKVDLAYQAWEKLNGEISDKTATVAALTHAKDRIQALKDEADAIIATTMAGLAMQEAMVASSGPTEAQIRHFESVRDRLEEVRFNSEEYTDSILDLDSRIKELNKEQKKQETASKAVASASDTAKESTYDLEEVTNEYVDALLKANPELDAMADALWDLIVQEDLAVISTEKMNAQTAALYGSADLAKTGMQDLAPAVKEMADEADPYAEAWTHAIERVDSAFADMWKGAFDSFSDFGDSLKNAFEQLLAELAHAAITRPIMISLGLGSSGTASAAGSLLDGDGGITGIFSGIGNLFTDTGIGEGFATVIDSLFGAGGMNVGATDLAMNVGTMSNWQFGAAGLLGGLFGSQFGGEYGGTLGGLGASIGMMFGPLGAIAGAGIGTLLSTVGGDDNENSLLKLWTGDQFNKDSGREWEETIWGLLGYNSDGDPNRIQYDMPFGTMGASGQHIGNADDMQMTQEEFETWLAGVGELFEMMGALDTSIIESLDLSDEKIKEIQKVTETMAMEVGEMESPDAAAMIKKRYDAVFDTIGGLADHVYDSFNEASTGFDTLEIVASTAVVLQTVDELGGGFDNLGSDMVDMSVAMVRASDDISLIDATQLTAVFVASIDIMDNLFADFEQSVSANATTMWGAWNDQTTKMWDLVRAFDASYESTINLVSAMEDQYNSTVQLLTAIDSYQETVSTATDDQQLSMRLDMIGINWDKNDQGLGAVMQRNYLDEINATKLSGLSSMTDPDAIMAALGDYSSNISQIWGLLTDTEKSDYGDYYIQLLQEAEDMASARLEAAEAIVQTRHDNLVDAITTGFEGITMADLGAATEQFSGSVTDFNTGASDISSAANTILSAAGAISGAATTIGAAASDLKSAEVSW